MKRINIDLEVITKHSILSAIARIYDPCGFLAPITILGRMLLLLAWDANLSWDQLLPEDMQDEWKDIVALLNDALTIPIPRWVGFRSFEGVSVHCFVDASVRSLGAVVYLVGASRSVMFTARAKVCPVKMDHFSVPRKELCAISLGV